MQFAWAIPERWACKQQLIRTQPQIRRHVGEARIAPALSVGQEQHNTTNNSSSSRASNAAARQTTFCTCSTAADRSSIESPHDLSDQQQHRHDQEHDQPSVAEGSKQLLLSIQQAANVQQLQAILGPCWTQVDPVHATAALKQLVLLQLQQTQQQQPRQPIHWQQGRKQAAAASSESLPESHHPQQQQQSIGTCQDPRVTELGLQLLHSSVQGSEIAAVSVPTQATKSAVTDGAQSSSLSAAQASDILHAVAQLQLVPEAAQGLLHLLLQHAIQPLPGTASLTAEQLLQLLQGAVWLLGCNQQQQQQQQKATTDAAVSSEPGSAPGAQAEHTSQNAPQAQQQQQQQHTSGSAAVRPMQRPLSPQQQHALLEAKRQQLLQRSNPRLQQQQVQGQGRHSAVQQLLLQVLRIWCQQQTAAEGTARDAEAAMSSQQLMQLLSLLLELRLLPEPVCLQQLLQLAGLQQQQQHHHHHLRQQQGLWSPADAAAVLTKLVDLAKLAHSTAQSSSSSSTVQLLGVVQQHAEQLLLLALGTNAQSEAAPVAADVSAGGRLVPSQQYTRQQQQQQQQQQKWPGTVGLSAVSDLLALTATSSSSSSNAPAASNASGVQLQQRRQVPSLLLLSPSTMRVLMDTLLSSVVHPLHSSRQQQQQEGAQQRQQRHRQQQLPQDVLSSADILAAATTASELFQLQRQWDQTHQQQQQHQQHGPSSSSSSDPATSTAVDNRVVRPLRFQLWLQEYVSCALHPKRRLQDVTASELTALLGLLVRHKAHMPPWWLGGAEERVLLLLQVLCAARTAGGVREPGDPLGAAAKLLHGWVQLLQVQPRRRSADAGGKASSSGGRQANSSSGSYIDNSSSSSSGGSAYKPYFLRSSWFMRKACTALQPALQAMDTTSLGLTAVAVAQLGVPQELQQGWVQAVLAAASAAADRADCDKPAVVESAASAQPPQPPAAAAAAAAPLATEVAEPPPAAASTTSAQPHQDIRLPGEAVVNLLQSLALLRVRPTAVLLQRLLLLLRRDMVLERGPVLVGLLVVLSQLRYRPGPEWLRAVLLRLQGRLRLLSFDQLTQLCWCLTLVGIQPPQAWQDDFMDAAAVHIIAERKRQQQWDTRHKQRQLDPQLGQASSQQQQQREEEEGGQGAEGMSVMTSRPRLGHPAVHPWQLQLMHWAVLQVWRYRSMYRHGKLQWRAVRELNRAVWRLPQQKALLQLQAQFHHQQQQQQHRERLHVRRLHVRRLHERLRVRQGSKTSQGTGESTATMRSAKRQRLMLSSKVAKLQWVMQARKAKGQAIKRHRRTMAQQQHSQQQELGSIAQQQQQQQRTSAAAAGGGSSKAIATPDGGRQLTSSSSSRSGTYSSSSRVRQGRWQLRGRAQWVDAALWPKQWQLATLPAQQYQGQGPAGR